MTSSVQFTQLKRLSKSDLYLPWTYLQVSHIYIILASSMLKRFYVKRIVNHADTLYLLWTFSKASTPRYP